MSNEKLKKSVEFQEETAGGKLFPVFLTLRLAYPIKAKLFTLQSTPLLPFTINSMGNNMIKQIFRFDLFS